MGTEPLLLLGIAIATRTHSGEGPWQKPALLCRRSRSKPVDDGLGKLQKVVDIGKIRRQSDRNTERSLLAIVNDVEKLLIRHTLFLAKGRGQILAHQAQGDFTHAWITKAAAAHREPGPVGLLLDRITIKDCSRRITEIEGDGPAAPLRRDWTIDLHRWLTVAMAQVK